MRLFFYEERKMKFSALISVLFLCFVFVACVSDEDSEKSCITAFDCPDGYSCIDSICQPPVAETDADHDVDDGSQDVKDDSDSGNSDSILPGENDVDIEIPDGVVECPNGCSGFGECNFETGICTCTDNHGGEDCSECAEGYHWEAEDDDEDGNPDIRSCVVNQTCDPNPCNNNGCKEVGDTVKCTCAAANHQGGRWCERCADGYLLNNAGVCKEDCTLKTCTPPQKCGIDYASNEASCNACENEYYTGTDCKSCDPVHFCNGHATACVVEGGTEKCTCEAAYTGSTCNTCASGYFQSNGVCIKNCEVNKCFKSYTCVSPYSDILTATVEGHGTCNSSTGGCNCDAGWLTGTSTLGVGTTVQCGMLTAWETLNNVECAICDKNNPPSQYASSGCPQELTGDTSLCNSMYSLTFCGFYGSCYYEPTGSHQLYCVCGDGYHLDNGNKYSGYCVADSEE